MEKDYEIRQTLSVRQLNTVMLLFGLVRASLVDHMPVVSVQLFFLYRIKFFVEIYE